MLQVNKIPLRIQKPTSGKGGDVDVIDREGQGILKRGYAGIALVLDLGSKVDPPGRSHLVLHGLE